MRGPPPQPAYLKLLRGNPGQRAVKREPEPASRHNFRHARSSRTAILREEEAGFYVRLHEDGSITWEGHVTLAQTDPSRRVEEARERQLANSTCFPASGIMYVRSQGPGDRVRPDP